MATLPNIVLPSPGTPRRPDHHRARHRHAQRRRFGLHRRVRAGRGRVDRCRAEPGTAGSRPGAPRRHQHSFAWLPEDDFVNHFAVDVDPVKAKVMFAVQQPLH